jgi:hypothetical protein
MIEPLGTVIAAVAATLVVMNVRLSNLSILVPKTKPIPNGGARLSRDELGISLPKVRHATVWFL